MSADRDEGFFQETEDLDNLLNDYCRKADIDKLNKLHRRLGDWVDAVEGELLHLETIKDLDR